MSKELIDKFNDHVCECDCLDENHEHDDYSGFCSMQSIYHKKQCAIIALEHTIEALEKLSWNDIRPSIETKLMDSLIGEEILEYQKQLEELKTK